MQCRNDKFVFEFNALIHQQAIVLKLLDVKLQVTFSDVENKQI